MEFNIPPKSKDDYNVLNSSSSNPKSSGVRFSKIEFNWVNFIVSNNMIFDGDIMMVVITI